MGYMLDGYCGLFCGACPNMLATKAGTADKPCHGCKSEQPTGYCAVCGIRACARGKGYEFCQECAGVNACKQLWDSIGDAQWPYQQGVWTNLQTIRIEGKAKWMEAQDRRWRCAACGASHSWWDETCPRCGRAVASYRADQC